MDITEKEVVAKHAKVDVEWTHVMIEALKWNEKLKTLAAIAKASNMLEKKLREMEVFLHSGRGT
jgi:hypothetical protein